MKSQDPNNRERGSPTKVLGIIKAEVQQRFPKLDHETLDQFLLILREDGLDAALEAIVQLITPRIKKDLTEACEASPIRELISELRRKDGVSQQKEDSQSSLQVIQQTKTEIEKADLKMNTDILQVFLSVLETKGLANALQEIKDSMIPRVLESLHKMCETSPVKELISQLSTGSKAGGLRMICQVLKKELERQQKFAGLVTFADEFTESFLKDGAEGFLKGNPEIQFLLRLEIAYIFFSNEEIADVLENSDEREDKRIQLLNEVEGLLTLYTQEVDENELPGILKYFKENLDLKEFLSKIKNEMIPKNFEKVRVKIEKDERIPEIIIELKKPLKTCGEQKQRPVQAQALKNKLKLGKQFIGYCGNLLEAQEAEKILQNLCESLDLEEAIEEIRKNASIVRKNVFTAENFIEIKMRIESDEDIKNSIVELRQMQPNREGGDNDIQVMLEEMKAKIWEKLNKILPQEQELLIDVRQKVLEDFDLESAIIYLQQNLAPKIFNPLKAKLDSDTEIANLIDQAAMIKIKQLEGQIVRALNKHKPQLDDDDEHKWTEVQEDLKKGFSLEKSFYLFRELMAPKKYNKLLSQVAGDAELVKTIEDLRDLKAQGEDDNKEEQFKRALTQHFIKLLESKVYDKDILKEAATVLGNSLKTEDALEVLRYNISPIKFKALDIENIVQNDETLKKMLIEIEGEKKKMSSANKALQLITDFVVGEISLINGKISAYKIKRIKGKISKLLATKHNIQGLFDDIVKFINESKFGLPAEKVENIKKEALKSPSITNINNYLKIKEVIINLFETCQICDDQLANDVSSQLYESQNLEIALAPVKSKYPGSSYDRLLELGSKNEDLERIAFEGLEQAPDSFMKKDYIKKARDLIQGINSRKVKYTLVIDLLQHIYKNGLHDGIDLGKYQKEDRTIMEEILKKIDKDQLRLEIDGIKVREELEKDIQEVIVDLKPELLKQIVEEILKKGLMSALMEEAENHLNKKLALQCLNKIVPYLQTKEIYKATKLYEKDLATWSMKVDSLFSKLINKVQNKEDFETINDIKEYLKIGSLGSDDIKEIKRVLTRIGQENKYFDIGELLKKIFERDYVTMTMFKELESSGEERDERKIEDLLKYQLKFNFQFKEVENYINQVIYKDFDAGEELYKEQSAKYPELAKSELLNYKEYIKKDKQVLAVLVELENVKELYKKDQNQKVLDDVNKRVIPKLFGINKDLYKMWMIRNKSEDFLIKDYEILSSEYALHPVEACDKAKKIALSVKLPDIHLETFNVVTFKSSQEEQDLMIKNWIQNLEDPEKFEGLLPIYFNLLKRGEDWEIFAEKVNKNILSEKLSEKLGFFKKKFLFYLFFISGDKELKVKLLQLYGNYNPIPLTYTKWPIDPASGAIQANDNQALEYEFNELIYYTIQPSLGILSLGLGNKASLPIGKSEILNKVFKKNFGIAGSSPFHVNTIDIDFDSSFRPYRQFCVADAHGKFPLNQLPYFLALFRILIVHVHVEDLSQDKIGTELETFCRTVLDGNYNNHVVVLIRDDSLDEEYYEKDQKILKKKFPQLEPVLRLPEQSISIASLSSFVELNSNEQSVVNQKLQNSIFGAIQPYKDEITVTKETFLKHLLKNLKNEDHHDIFKVENTLRAFLSEMKKHLDNFFDEKAFPCYRYLSELRKIQKILRTAKIGADLNQAKIAYAELEEKLKNVNSTTLMKLFAEILRGENSYLIIMELLREIKDIVSGNTKKLLQERDELLYEINQRAPIQDDPSTADARRLKQIENQKKLKQKNEEIDQRSLSIEVIWGELMALYNYNKQEVIETLDIDPVEKIKEFVDKGEPFELFDGDNMQFNENFLKEVVAKLKGKMCTISILGHKRSGKSTLVNRLFGCQFGSNVGKCTRKIYLSILKVNNPNFEYLMILDIEGLQGVEKNDDEFDRKITLFCLAVSQIIIVNVKGDLHLPMKSLLEICTMSLHKLDLPKINRPTIHFVFNQNPPTKDKTSYIYQVSSMMDDIIAVNPEAQSMAEILIPSKHTLHILGFAFQTWKEEKNANRNIWQDWPYTQPQSSFANECAALSQRIYETMNDRFVKSSESQNVFAQFKEWSRMANDIWKMIDMYTNMIECCAIPQIKEKEIWKSYE